MSKLNRACTVVVAVWGALAGSIPSRGAEAGLGGLNGEAARGKQLYRRYCVGCHGVKGDGQGDNAPYMDPRPRDFTTGTFKCRSTPTGTLPLESDLLSTIGRGIFASSMPSWKSLTAQERALHARPVIQATSADLDVGEQSFRFPIAQCATADWQLRQQLLFINETAFACRCLVLFDVIASVPHIRVGTRKIFLLTAHTSDLLFIVVDDSTRNRAGFCAIIAQNAAPDLMANWHRITAFKHGKPNPFDNEGFCVRRFSGGFPAAMTPHSRWLSVVLSVGQPVTLPASVRRCIR